MKRFGLLILTIILVLTQVQAQVKSGLEDMVFDKTVNGVTSHDFGSIVYGANGKIDFAYTNNGTKPLIITDVKSSCGCTIPNWSKDPLEPGKKGILSIQYNTTIPGVFNKTVTVFSNANNSPVRISVKGKVNSQPSDIKKGNGQQASSPPLMDDNIKPSKKDLQREAAKQRLAKEKGQTVPVAKPGTETKKPAGTAVKTTTGTNAIKK